MNETPDTLRTDLIELCKKHNIKSASFCGNDQEHYHGFTAIEPTDSLGTLEAVVNVGRLWQHTRTVVRRVLDEFERGA